MKDGMTIQERIARRIVSSIYSWYELEKGRAYVFLDHHSLPSYYVERLAKNSYRVIKFNKTQFSSAQGRGMFNSILIVLKSGNDQMLKSFSDCIQYDHRISAGKAVAPLLGELGMTLPEFERLFHTETDFTSGGDLAERSHRKWRVVFEKGTREQEQVLELLDRVDELLGGFADALSYGIVEIKNDLPPNVLADYNPKNDSMRVKSDCSDGRILHSFVHELAHRLWFKWMSKSQRRSVLERYHQMLQDSSSFILQGFDGDVFPSEYSRTSVEEFFAECFAYWRGGGLCESLSEFLGALFHPSRHKAVLHDNQQSV